MAIQSDPEIAATGQPEPKPRRDSDGATVLKELDTAHVDVGAQLLASTAADFDPAVTRRALWKIDLRVLPVLAFTTGLQFLDKSTLGYAAIFGIIQDTNLEGDEYSWLASIFYFGYLVMQPIAAQLLQKLQPAKCLAVSVFLWGVILFMHIVCKNWSQLMAIRFLLGMAEGIVTPAFMLISSAWYSRQDQPLRMGIWFSFNGVALILGGLLAYGLGHINVGIASWKWMFIVTGALSVIWAVVIWFLLPDNQGKAWFLNDSEKRAALEMVRLNHTGIHNDRFQRQQLVEALLDPKTWMFALMALVWNVPNSIATFGNLVIKNFHYGVLETTLLGMPSGALEFVLMISITFVCLKLNNVRTWCMAVALLIALVGSVMVFAAPYGNKAALLCGYYFIYAFPTGYILLLATASANVAGHTKKVVTNSLLLIGYSAGNVIGPQFFLTSQEPRYALGIGSCVVSFAILIVMTLSLRFYLAWQNKTRRDARLALEEQSTAHELAGYAFRNLTDKENPLFVYVY